MTSALTIEHVVIGDLRPDSFNPRRISDAELESLTRSIQEFGLVAPLIARSEDRTVIGGHQRLLAARRLGMTTVPVVFVDLTLEQAKLLNLALNRISGEWDQELLARLLQDLQQVPDVDLTLSGFAEDEISKLLKSLEARDKRDRPESFDLEAALEAARADPGVERGDIWLLGDHRVMCGDATDSGDVSRLVGAQHASMAFTDPPYNVDYGHHGGAQQRGRRRTIANDALPPEEWETFCRAWAKQLLDNVDGALYICMSTREWPMVSHVLEELGGHWSDTIIWAKDRFVLGRADYQRQYEPLWFGWREGASHHWCGDRSQGDVWTIPRPAESELHPTMKPLALVERAIENSSHPGDLVLDLFLGSGTTLIAAERTGRVCFGMELDAHYCRIVIARWEAFTGLKAEKLSK
jgi:DNA modification methylase